MALRELLAALEAEIDAEVAQAIQADEERAAAILAAGRRQADEERERIIADLMAEAVATAAVTTAAARAQARRTMGRARHTALAAVREEADRRLAALPGTPEGAAIAQRCVAEVLAALPDAVILRVHPGDAADIEAADLDVRDDLGSGGAYAVGPDGSFVDNSLPTRLANTWTAAQVDLVQQWESRSEPAS